MSPEQFRHQYLSLYTVSGESFFPVSVFPIYLDLKNFNNTVTLNCISLTITYLQQDTEPENLFFKYENCELGVKEISDSRKIGIVIPKMLKCCLLKVIDSKRPFSSILNIKMNEKTNDFAVMDIRCFEKNIYVSTFPILNHILIESNFSYSQVYLDRLQKYKFLHYLYLLTCIRRQDQVKEIVGSSMLRVTTVNINCYTPVFLYRLKYKKTNSFDKQMISVANDPSKPLLVHYSPEYPSLYSDSPITALKFCYDKSQKGTFKLNFTESINTIDNITHCAV
ncbi:hypothetical protein CDIK_4473 [Cucumispora dikerogammari]|nr:hypothetical protein CDIK_4473 [Cucumispora dikerogammari]